MVGTIPGGDTGFGRLWRADPDLSSGGHTHRHTSAAINPGSCAYSFTSSHAHPYGGRTYPTTLPAHYAPPNTHPRSYSDTYPYPCPNRQTNADPCGDANTNTNTLAYPKNAGAGYI